MATDISTALPFVDLEPGATITVDTGDANVVVTEMNVYALQSTNGGVTDLAAIPALFAYSTGG